MYQPAGQWQAGALALQPVRPLRARLQPVELPPARPADDDPLAVDLSIELFSRRWWRGVATLGLLGIAASLLAPPLAPLPAGRPAPLAEAERRQWQAVAIAPLGDGGRTGLAMAETGAVEPLSEAPQRARIDLFASLGRGDSLAALLVRSGARASDASESARLIAAAVPGGIAAGTSIAITLGRSENGVRPVERLALRAALDLRLRVDRDGGSLRLNRMPIAIDRRPLRIRGRVGDGLYWSLRAAGVAPDTAQAYLRALATQLDLGGDLGRDDRFDLVVANRRAATGENVPGPLLYAGLDRLMGRDLQLLRWPVGGRSQWLEASGVGQQPAAGGMAWPVNARITSGFGWRVHPILRFRRMHSGIDFGARWGSPIAAAADGQVTRAGWAGGYGQQVRLAHGGGLSTSYSHMSRITVSPGTVVRQGQLIGYVGSTGLSTGPHLHYEVLRGGRAVDPQSVRFVSRAPIDGAELAAFRARLRQLLSAGGSG